MPNTHETLTSLFSDIADAIRAKTGGAANIIADNFPSAIAAIPSGGSVTVEPLSVTENGTYTAPSGTAYSPVTVNVESGGGDVSLSVVGDSVINDYNIIVDIDISDYVDYYDIKVVFVVQSAAQYTSDGDIACAFIVLDVEPSAVLFYQNGGVSLGTNGAGAAISGTTLRLQSRWRFTPNSTVFLYGTEK